MTSPDMWKWVEENYFPKKNLASFESGEDFFDEMFVDAESGIDPFDLVDDKGRDITSKNSSFVNNVMGAFESKVVDKMQDARAKIITEIEPSFQEVIEKQGFIPFDRQIKIIQEEYGFSRSIARKILT